MKELIRKFERESGLEIYGLGARRDKWEHCMEKFAELIIKECAQVAFEGDLKRAIGQWGSHSDILKHFEVEHDVVKTFRS